jgi:hypothetical protein
LRFDASSRKSLTQLIQTSNDVDQFLLSLRTSSYGVIAMEPIGYTFSTV